MVSQIHTEQHYLYFALNNDYLLFLISLRLSNRKRNLSRFIEKRREEIPAKLLSINKHINYVANVRQVLEKMLSRVLGKKHI